MILSWTVSSVVGIAFIHRVEHWKWCVDSAHGACTLGLSCLTITTPVQCALDFLYLNAHEWIDWSGNWVDLARPGQFWMRLISCAHFSASFQPSTGVLRVDSNGKRVFLFLDIAHCTDKHTLAHLIHSFSFQLSPVHWFLTGTSFSFSTGFFV